MFQSLGRPYYPSPVHEPYLWHYFTSDKLYKLDTFLNGGLWLAQIESFEPKGEEGSIPEANKARMGDLREDQFQNFLLEYEKAKLITYASCWTRSKSNCPDFNNHSFGGTGDAIALRTTPQKLLLAAAIGFATPVTTSESTTVSPVYFGSVEYIDYSFDLIPEAQTIAAAYAIKLGYEQYENEARLLAYCCGEAPLTKWRQTQGLYGQLIENKPGGRLSELQGAYNNGKAIVIKIDPIKLIEEIHIGPNVSPANRKKVLDKVKDNKFDLSRII